MLRKKVLYVMFVSAISLPLIFTGCGTGGNGANKTETKTISIVGSTSVAPLAQELADEYENVDANVKIDIQSVGSTAGIKAVNDGTCEIGISSRELKSDEKAWNLTETVIAKDGIAVIINPVNNIKELSDEQITKIFNGQIKNWKEVGGADMEILVVSREAGSGTRGAFEELTGLEKKEGDKTISLVVENALIAEGNGAVMANVSGKKNAIGYMSMGLVDKTKVTAVKVNGTEASEDNVKSGKYEISRPFIMLTKGTPNTETKSFIDYILSDAGQKIVADEYVSIK